MITVLMVAMALGAGAVAVLANAGMLGRSPWRRWGVVCAYVALMLICMEAAAPSGACAATSDVESGGSLTIAAPYSYLILGQVVMSALANMVAPHTFLGRVIQWAALNIRVGSRSQE